MTPSLRHPRQLREGAVEVVDLLEDIPTPHETEVAVAVRQFVHDALMQDDSVRHARLRDGTTSPLDVQCHRIDADADDAGDTDELDQVARIPAYRVTGTWCFVLDGERRDRLSSSGAP